VVSVVRRWGAVALLLLMTSCGTPNNAAGPPGQASAAHQPTPSAASVPFPEFLAEVKRASYRDYAGKPDTKVQSEPAFEEMRRYLLNRYGSARVGYSYALADATFDCIATDGAGPSAGPVPPGSACPAGTVPVRRITLAELVRFSTLQSFLGKGPDGGGLPPVPSR
jgi:hypothetical protein